MKHSKYSTPILKKGKDVTFVPKGSSKAAEQAKLMWYVEYIFNGKQIRTKGGINRIKSHIDKQYQADVLLQSIKEDLRNGFDPTNPNAFLEQIQKENISLKEAITIFKTYHVKHKTKKKTIGTYMSKLLALSMFYPGKQLQEISTIDLENFVQSKIDDGTYAHNSVKSAKRIFSTFFAVLKKGGYISTNPKEDFDKKIKSTKETSEKHIPFTDGDLKKLLDYLDANDKYAAFFCRMIYYTCIRPGEIRDLEIRDINLNNNTITIRASVKKINNDDQNQIIEIDKNLRIELEKLNLGQYPKNFYLTGSTKNIVGEKKVGENTPYNKLMTALENINKADLKNNPNLKESDMITNQGYDLYCLKHKSNLNKYLSGWTLAEIMKSNRHTSISMTEIYLKKLGSFTDIKHLEVPKI